MSLSEVNKVTYKHNGSEKSYSIEQENISYATNILDSTEQKETVTPRASTLEKNKDFLCVDFIDDTRESPVDKNEKIEAGKLNNKNTEIEVKIVNEREARRQLTVKDLYGYVVGIRQKSRMKVLHPEQSPPQPRQITVWTQDGPKSHDPLRGPVPPQAPKYPQGKGPIQAQGYYPPQGQGYPPPQGYAQGYPQQGYPHQQGYPQGYPPQQGYFQGYPQGQGYGPPQEGYQQAPRGQGYPRGRDGGGYIPYEPESRNPFIAKVFTLVFIMLAITAAFVATVYNVPKLRLFFLVFGIFIVIGSSVGMCAVACCMCCPFARQPPCNYVFLVLTVVLMSLLTAVITSIYNTTIILYALIATAVTVIVCIALACTSFDFTKCWLYVIVISVAFSVLALIIMTTMMAFGIKYTPVKLAILCIGTLINVVTLIMELQAIIGGKTVQLGEDEYVLGAILIYMSIIDIFIKMLQIFGLISGD